MIMWLRNMDGKESNIKMKYKVLHCLGQLNIGGAETLVMNVYRNIDTTKYQFDFLVFKKNKGYYDKEVVSKGSNIYILPSLSETGVIKYIKNLISFFSSHEIDVVHCHMDWLGGFIAYAANKAGIKKIIVHSHAKQDMFSKNIVYKILIKFSKMLITKYATDCLACSKEAGESLFNEKFAVLFNGIDMKKYVYPDIDKIEQIKNDLHINNDYVVLGMVGSLSENKNQEFAIKLFNKYHRSNHKSKLIIVGDGSLRNYLENLTKELNIGDNVIFTGVCSDIAELMHTFDVFLLPSKTEGFGIVAIEAQACGIPSIVSTGVPKLVDMNLGLIKFKDLDINSWLSLITKKKIQTNTSLLIGSMFDISVTVNEIEKIYSVK